MAHQYAPVVEPGGRIVTRRWPDDPVHQSLVEHPRDDLLLERPEAEVCPDAWRPKPAAWTRWRSRRSDGPFTPYRRTVERDGDELVESTEYGVTIPWFGWLFRWPLSGAVLAAADLGAGPWWAPPDRLDPTATPGARPAGGRVDECGLRQHAVHPDRQLRRRRLRRRQHRRRHRRRVRPRRHRHRPAGRADRRPDRTTPGDRVRGVARSAAVACSARSPRRSASSSSPRRWRARWASRSPSSSASSPPRRCRATAAPTPSASWRWPPASAPVSP